MHDLRFQIRTPSPESTTLAVCVRQTGAWPVSTLVVEFEFRNAICFCVGYRTDARATIINIGKPNPTVRSRDFGGHVMLKRRRFKQPLSLKDRLGLFAKDARASADELPPGPAKDNLVRKARQADTAMHLHDGSTLSAYSPPTR
jgi:hypothetical protein